MSNSKDDVLQHADELVRLRRKVEQASDLLEEMAGATPVDEHVDHEIIRRYRGWTTEATRWLAEVKPFLREGESDNKPLGGVMKSLEDQLCELLAPYAGETGVSEGARDTLQRIINDRNRLRELVERAVIIMLAIQHGVETTVDHRPDDDTMALLADWLEEGWRRSERRASTGHASAGGHRWNAMSIATIVRNGPISVGAVP